MNLSDVLNAISAKTGHQNEQAIIDVLGHTELRNIELDDAIANAIIGGLLTVDAAKNHPTVRNHFKSIDLGPIDSDVLKYIKTLELGDDFEAEISGLKNTYEKNKRFLEKIKETFDTIKASPGKGDDKTAEKYAKRINDLLAENARIKETTIPKTEYEKFTKEKEDEVRNYMIHSKISGLNFANQDVNKDDNIAFANVILNNRLSKAKAVITKEGNDLKLKQSEDTNLYYLDEQQKGVSFDDFMNKAFADAKILAVSDAGKTKSTTGPAQQAQYGQFAPTPGTLNTSKFDAAMNTALNGE
jgi:hypothetical protein